MDTALIPALGAEHADGTVYADVTDAIWMPTPFGWARTQWLPFAGPVTELSAPGIEHGPYRAVLAPPERMMDP